jgi:hypothetical protein
MRYVNELSAVNTLVGAPLVAVVDSADITVLYSDLGTGNGSALFSIGGCDGQIRVRTAAIDRNDTAAPLVYVLTVAARPNGDPTAQTVANVTISVLDVPEPPVFAGNFSLAVFENQTAGADSPFAFVQGAWRGVANRAVVWCVVGGVGLVRWRFWC